MLGGLKPKGPKGNLKGCISFLRKGGLLAYVGRIHNLKDLKGRMQVTNPITYSAASRIYIYIYTYVYKYAYCRFFERPGLNYGHLTKIKWPEILSFSLGPKKINGRERLKMVHTFFSIFVLPILFSAFGAPHGAPSFPAPQVTPPPLLSAWNLKNRLKQNQA